MIYETYSVGGVLYHHGIQGMHWGVQNGPPYPLSKSISTGSRLKESAHGKKKLAKGNTQNVKKTFHDRIKDRKEKKEIEKAKKIAEKAKKLSNEVNTISPKSTTNAYADTVRRRQMEINDQIRRQNEITRQMEINDQIWRQNEITRQMMYQPTFMGVPKNKKFDAKEWKKRYEQDQKMAPDKLKEAVRESDSISKQVAKGVISDLKRWSKQSDLSEKQLKKINERLNNKNANKYYETIIKEKIKNASSPGYNSSDDTVNFVIDGLDEAYGDYQPITIEYDLKNKKVKYFYWT